MKSYLILILISINTLCFSQKTPLNFKDFDSWNAISEKEISNDGFWTVYTFMPQDGDGKLIFFPLKGNRIDTVARGAEFKISQNSQFVVFKIKPQRDTVYKAKLAKIKKEDLPKDSLGIYELSKNKLSKIPKVKSFILSEKADNFLVYHAEFKADSSKSKQKKENADNGSKLTIFNLQNSQKTEFPFVTKYAVDEKGENVLFHSTGKDSSFAAGIYLYSSLNQTQKILYKGLIKTKQLEISVDGQQAGFIINADSSKKSVSKKLQLYYWKNGQETAELIVDSTKASLELNDDKALEFAKDGSKLFYYTSEPFKSKRTDIIEEDEVKVDVWNWKDRKLVPQVLLETKDGKRKTYLAVFNSQSKKIFQLATPDIPNTKIVNEGKADFVLAYSELPYSNQHWDWNGRKDLFIISTKNGESQKIAKEVTCGSTFDVSPQGRYVYWYSLKDTTWFVYTIRNEKLVKLPLSRFADEENDSPDYPSAYGLAGWTSNDDDLLLYDRYDIIKFNPESDKVGQYISNGRTNRTVYRYLSIDPKERNINLNKNLYFHQFNEINRFSGYTVLANTGTEMKGLILEPKYFSRNLLKSKESNDLVFTRESFEEYPDLYIANDSNFEGIQKISTANPQQKNKIWGHPEMLSWTSLEGKKLEGVLYKPENFDSTKSYPMITYFYEKLSDDIYKYKTPQPERASINYSYYTSNGYFVFVPDIVYKDGYPGMSAYNCIMPGVMKVLERKYINPKKLALQGHSWGGYQTAYLITKTDMFAAAEAGAPVANMTSAYGGIRWETGVSRMPQYEKTQSRIGATLWEKPMHFIENSPLFYLPNIKTPLLMMHNDADGAVPWYQGIEMFMGLKRLDKPVWMLNYNGEKHGLTERRNKKDWSMRMVEFFDHYLKDAEAPEWMQKGK